MTSAVPSAPEPSHPGPLVTDRDGARLAVHLTPRAGRAGIQAVTRDAAGRAWLKVAVTAAPEAGKANAALIALLARAWRLPKGAFSIAAGVTDRRKILHVRAGAQALETVTRALDRVPRR